MRQFARKFQLDRIAIQVRKLQRDISAEVCKLQQDRIADRVSMRQFVNAIAPGGGEVAEQGGLITLRNGADLLEAQRLGVFAPMLQVLASSGMLSLNPQLPTLPPLDGLAAFRLACAVKPSNSLATTKLLKPIDLHSQHLALIENSPISALSDLAYKAVCASRFLPNFQCTTRLVQVPSGGSVLVEITFKHFLVIAKNEVE
ncbi:hypothetical protein EXIGLDRAFT_762400 [Exidia glandulosa HHB12029]|uniref:Uncharacterized protein n=1 Tax=Exidia glandulosa HHB12029 TaxID=1314781 RepID=A0A165MTW0_EXIGL|nr:hypothetical protein EXIGLDRAFT_762400 [Exidia glandulosa HHB12029]